jgi:hypothetical protein
MNYLHNLHLTKDNNLGAVKVVLCFIKAVKDKRRRFFLLLLLLTHFICTLWYHNTMLILTIACLLFFIPFSTELNNGLGRTPQMGEKKKKEFI